MKRCALILTLLALASPTFAVWPPPIRLTDGPNENINPFLSMQDGIFPTQDSVFLVWQRSRTGGWDIYSRGTAMYDTLWSPPRVVTSLPDSNLKPSVASYGQLRYCVWVNCHGDSQNILFSSWAGGAWGPPVYLTRDTFPDTEPSVFRHPYADTVWVAWASFRSQRWGLYSRFLSGTTWSPEIPIIANGANHRSPRLFRFAGFTRSGSRQYVSVVWQSDASGNWGVLLSHYQSGVWGAPIRVTTGAQSHFQPSPMRGFVQWLDYRVNILWASDSLGNWEVWGTNADSLIARERMTVHNATDNEPSCVDLFFIIATPTLNHPYLTAWTSDRDGNRNIYAEFRGAGFEAVDTNRANDVHPQTAAVYRPGGMRFWIVWQSNRNGNWNLYGSNRLIFIDEVEGESPMSRSEKTLRKVYPTPFRPYGPLVLALPQSGHQIVLKLYDLKGNQVSTQMAKREASGLYRTTWDGRDALGHTLPSGLYFLRPEGSPILHRLLLLR
jgi:hypothetical protein